jgi:two-component system, response regulator PdtaR
MILLVEDEPLIAMALEAELTDAGHTVRGPASTAGRALQLAEIAPPDLALVDINLRDGAGQGIQLARELSYRCGTPSLFVSGQRAEAEANQDAAIGFIEKPYDPAVVLKAIEIARIINEGGTPPPSAIPRGLELFRRS